MSLLSRLVHILVSRSLRYTYSQTHRCAVLNIAEHGNMHLYCDSESCGWCSVYVFENKDMEILGMHELIGLIKIVDLRSCTLNVGDTHTPVL